jgi:hypothetical protein
MRKIVTLGILGLLALGVSATASADDTRPRRQGPRVIELPILEIEGRFEIPLSFVLVRSETGYQLVEQRTSFVDEVVRSTGAEAF